jgi:hypothetical protein
MYKPAGKSTTKTEPVLETFVPLTPAIVTVVPALISPRLEPFIVSCAPLSAKKLLGDTDEIVGGAAAVVAFAVTAGLNR